MLVSPQLWYTEPAAAVGGVVSFGVAELAEELPIKRLWELRSSSGELKAIIGPTTILDAVYTASVLRPGKFADIREVKKL